MASTGVSSGEGEVAEGASGVPRWEVRERVELTAKEEEIFSVLLGTVEMFELKTQLRVAGGWVRDKLLGRDSFDIDIALDDIAGKDFAEKVNKYLETKGEVARGVGVIRSNPDQSKHLETATMMIRDLWIDLVNLRAESYAEGSRIPTSMEFGTAEEDALRRDLTINSMFYNITTGQVEDLTNKGIEDLKQGVVRTPLPPMQTFLDDPLRVLRAIRFASRFGFDVDQELRVAASSEEVRAALMSKVSRERVGKELEGMLKGRDPVGAVELIHSLGLFSAVFGLPGESVEGSSVSLEGLPEGYQALGVENLREAQRLQGSHPQAFVGSTAQQDDDLAVVTRLAAVLLPLRNCTYPDKKKRPIPVCQFIIRESLKLKASYADTVCNLHTHSKAFTPIVKLLTSTHEPAPSDGSDGLSQFATNPRVQAGVFLWKETKATWRSALLLCAVLGEQGRDADSSSAKRARTSDDGTWERLCVEASSRVEQLGLDGVWQNKPLLNGKDIMSLLSLKGIQTKVWLDRALEWELAHPSGNAESCKKWLVEEKERTMKL